MPKADQGVSRERYAVIPRTLVFLTRNQTILLLKGSSKKKIWANRYNGVGGHIEQGEDILTAARRELKEETGLTAGCLELCGIVMVDSGENPGISIFVFKGECLSGDPMASEEGILEWVEVDNLQAYSLVEDLPILIGKVLAKKNDDPPFYARYHYDEKDSLVISFGA